LERLCRPFQKIEGERRMAAHLMDSKNNSASLRAFVEGVARITGRELPA
jgi:hypothetical protein